MKQIIIENLFNRFNYILDLKPDVTILTGPNGYGKSTILKIINSLSEGNFSYFSMIDFNKIIINFNNAENNITIEKNEGKVKINGKIIPPSLYKYRRIRDRNSFTLFDNNRVYDRNTGEMFFLKENEKQFLFLDGELIENKETGRYKSLFNNIKKSIGNIYFIKEQRLIKEKKTRSDQEIINVIEKLPENFKEHISEVSNDYSKIANKLDSSYPSRLFNTESGITEKQYKEKIADMTDKFERLGKYNISEMQNFGNVLFKEEHAKALKIYFDDFYEKYKVYEDFIKKLDLFTDIINSRLSFKEIKITRDDGIIVVDSEHKDRRLELNHLSSGEKQEIVMFYELIFKTSSNVLLLIDEPEISLHITWQKKFMDDLLQIVDYKGIKVIIATHSPQIINNHWERQIDLGELYGEQLYKG